MRGESLYALVCEGYIQFQKKQADWSVFNVARPSLENVITDHLIANGVTVQRWISVNEELPNLIPCGAGTGYSEAINVLTSGRKVLTALWDGIDFITDAEFWGAEDEEITHWCPVLLPLPCLPKEVPE